MNMKNRDLFISRFIKKQSGMATLICTLMLLMGASSIVIYCVKTQIFLMKIASNDIKQRKGFMNAESGLEAFFCQLKNSSSRDKLYLNHLCIKMGNCSNYKITSLSTEKYELFLNSKSITDQNIEITIISKGKNNLGHFISTHKRKVQIPTTNFRKPNASIITKGNFQLSPNATLNIQGGASDIYPIRAGGSIKELNKITPLKDKLSQKNKKRTVRIPNIQNTKLLDPSDKNYINSKTLFKHMFGISKLKELVTDPFQNERSKIPPKRVIDMRLNQGSNEYCEKKLNELKLSGGTVWIIGDCPISNRYISKNPITNRDELLIGSTLSPIKLVIEGGTIKSHHQYKLHLFGILYLVPLNGRNDHTSLKDPLKIDLLNINGNLLVDYEYVEAGKNMIVTYDYRVIESLLKLSNYGYEIIKGSWSDFE